MTNDEKRILIERINEKEKILNAYSTGKLKSKMYNEIEIEEKRQYFLSLTPVADSVKRWHYEIKRVFELCKTFKECPDMWFYHLETFAKYGI